jgi:hypothetical protein
VVRSGGFQARPPAAAGRRRDRRSAWVTVLAKGGGTLPAARPFPVVTEPASGSGFKTGAGG